MPFILQGRLFELNPLSPEIDQEFRSLYNAFLGSGQYDLARFSEAANNFFDTYPSDAAKHDAYFTNSSLLWRHTLNAGNLQTAEHLWEIALAPAFTWEAKRPQAHVHEGTAFYLRGMTAVMRGELDRGYALMHQALGEDVLSHQTDVPDTPAYALVTMNSQKSSKRLGLGALQKAAIVARFIDQYCSVNKSAFTLRQFQDRFLLHPPSRETAFLFAYVIGRSRLNF